MQGLDLAFYKGRSKYHTKYDAVPYTDGHQQSLWAMMEAARGAGNALLNDSKTHDPDRYVPAVHGVIGVRFYGSPLEGISRKDICMRAWHIATRKCAEYG